MKTMRLITHGNVTSKLLISGKCPANVANNLVTLVGKVFVIIIKIHVNSESPTLQV